MQKHFATFIGIAMLVVAVIVLKQVYFQSDEKLTGDLLQTSKQSSSSSPRDTICCVGVDKRSCISATNIGDGTPNTCDEGEVATDLMTADECYRHCVVPTSSSVPAKDTYCCFDKYHAVPRQSEQPECVPVDSTPKCVWAFRGAMTASECASTCKFEGSTDSSANTR